MSKRSRIEIVKEYLELRNNEPITELEALLYIALFGTKEERKSLRKSAKRHLIEKKSLSGRIVNSSILSDKDAPFEKAGRRHLQKYKIKEKGFKQR